MGDATTPKQSLWIVDPIDGTVNYAHGHCQSAVSIAHSRNGEIVAGVVYNPFTQEMFWAEAGGGAFLNESLIEVAHEADPRRAIIATGLLIGRIKGICEAVVCPDL
ncbi:MAG: hypothetical protein H7A04_15885 [Pseudomonadales bacterium]|nr:hypothetical protein [Pseudomonadales bacterium]MCP5348337.1 hypothetical protein [Pseudomonadales bacterium]